MSGAAVLADARIRAQAGLADRVLHWSCGPRDLVELIAQVPRNTAGIRYRIRLFEDRLPGYGLPVRTRLPPLLARS